MKEYKLVYLNKGIKFSREKDLDQAEEIINEFIELLNNCEFARFAPGDPSKKMDELYHKGIDVITKIEKKLK